MSRIAYRLLVLLTCVVMFVGLIAARPLPQPGRARPSAWPAAPLPDGFPKEARREQAPAPLSLPNTTPPAPQIQETVAGLPVLELPETRPPTRPAMSPPVPAPTRIPGDGPPMPGTLVVQTERLDLYVGKQTFSAEQVAALAPVLERLLSDGEARLGTTLQRRVSIAFYRAGLAPARDVRGIAYTEEGRAEIFYRPHEDVERAATVAAHELGHHLEVQRYGEEVQRRADTILHEGLATWIAGERWLTMCGGTSWKERAQQLQQAGIPLRLLTAERSGANNAYELWASFVDFLVERYGWEQFDALYRSGRGRAPGSSDYEQVTGKSLDGLADEWREWIDK